MAKVENLAKVEGTRQLNFGQSARTFEGAVKH